jgi:hypothetical protein
MSNPDERTKAIGRVLAVLSSSLAVMSKPTYEQALREAQMFEITAEELLRYRRKSSENT